MLPVLAWLLALFAAPDEWFRKGKLLYSDHFPHRLSRWSIELEKPGRVEAKNGFLILDVPAGATVWFRPELNGPINVHARTGRFAEYNNLRVLRG